MEPPNPQAGRFIDLTGLPDEAIRAVEAFVLHLKGQQGAGIPAEFRSREEWAHAVREWAESHPTRDTMADDSRDALYADDRDE